MTRLLTTPAILGILVSGTLAAGFLAGCGSNQVPIGQQNADAQATGLGGSSGSGGAAERSSDAAAAGSGGSGSGGVTGNGGVTATGGSTSTGGTTGAGGATQTGGATGGGGTTGTGGAIQTGGTTGDGGATRTGGTTRTGGVAGTGGTGGSAGKTCGGIAGLLCATDEFCEMPTGSCNVADATGTCVVKPKQSCTTESRPVCGCDGTTYANDCSRQFTGVSKKADVACGAIDAGVLMTPTLPAACLTDGDCCVAVDQCMGKSYLVGQTEYAAMVASIANVSPEPYSSGCPPCAKPAVQVQCKGGFCAGEKLPFTSGVGYSHCGYISVPDAGTSTVSAHAAVDAGTGSDAGPSIWYCGH